MGRKAKKFIDFCSQLQTDSWIYSKAILLGTCVQLLVDTDVSSADCLQTLVDLAMWTWPRQPVQSKHQNEGERWVYFERDVCTGAGHAVLSCPVTTCVHPSCSTCAAMFSSASMVLWASPVCLQSSARSCQSALRTRWRLLMRISSAVTVFATISSNY